MPKLLRFINKFTLNFIGKNLTQKYTPKLAVLIDADNAYSAALEDIITEIATIGEATVKRIYGDFTTTHSAQWKKVLNTYSIKPIQQFAYTTGKNATDSMLIIDAMDLLYTKRFDGFCLVSSDSDFTSLALRIREEGLFVAGFGKQSTPESFRNACHRFISIESLVSQKAIISADVVKSEVATPATTLADPTPKPSSPPTQLTQSPVTKQPPLLRVSQPEGAPTTQTKLEAVPASTSQTQNKQQLMPVTPTATPVASTAPKPVVNQSVDGAHQVRPNPPIQNTAKLQAHLRKIIFEALAKAETDSEGWASLSAVGSILKHIEQGFEPSLYGAKNLSTLIRQIPEIKIDERSPDGSAGKAIYVRRKQNT